MQKKRLIKLFLGYTEIDICPFMPVFTQQNYVHIRLCWLYHFHFFITAVQRCVEQGIFYQEINFIKQILLSEGYVNKFIDKLKYIC